ncbi:MAG: sugar phosphate isomerase/epimerase [Chloroflexi bacterium]|nr:sugar phosphate isomerase/epimerase [Chloroflexota bacterium]
MVTSWPLALSTGMFLRHPLLAVLEPIKQAGFNRIEIASFKAHFNYHDLEQAKVIKMELDRLGLCTGSLHAPYSERIDLTLLQEEERLEAVSEVKAAVDALATLGGKTLVLHAGTATESPLPQTEQRLWQSARSLKQIYSYCQERHVILALEDMLPHLVGGRAAEMWWLLSQLPQEGVGICLDTGHSFLSGSLTDRLRLFGPRLLMLHAHDNLGKFDDHLPPGEGHIDWPGLLDRLFDTGFSGDIVLEIGEASDFTASLQRAQGSVALLKRCSQGKAYSVSL